MDEQRKEQRQRSPGRRRLDRIASYVKTILNLALLIVAAIAAALDHYGKYQSEQFERELQQIKVNDARWALLQKQFEAEKMRTPK
jgi:uncharacterized protein HemX